MSHTKPIIVNGVTYANQEELDARRKADATELAKLIYVMYQQHKVFERRLKEEPGGYAFPADGRLCHICMGGGAGEMWYDKRGMRCMDCQEAYKNKIIPTYVLLDRDDKRHLTESGIVVRFGIKHKDIRRLLREGKLKAREISHGKYPSTLIFLKRENPVLFHK